MTTESARGRRRAESRLQEELEDRLHRSIAEWRAVGGGDVAESHLARLTSGERLFVKDYGPEPAGVAAAEARGLDWLREARALRVPQVRAQGDGWLALEWIDSAPPAPDFDERLGEGLARLHRTGADAFGFGADNWIARLPQPNAPRRDWATFYAEQRLRPLIRRATGDGLLPKSLALRLDRLLDGMAERVGPEEPPARLHGDLWSGNVLADENGAPCLIDPAVYGGHREMDLAMMRLFGGFGPRTFEAYERVHPLAPGAAERIPLHQLQPLLVHVCLFGRGYVSRLSSAVDAALALPG